MPDDLLEARGSYPDVIEVIVEIPRGSRNKYEWDPEAKVMRLDRVLSSAVFYNFDYGFAPGTLAARRTTHPWERSRWCHSCAERRPENKDSILRSPDQEGCPCSPERSFGLVGLLLRGVRHDRGDRAAGGSVPGSHRPGPVSSRLQIRDRGLGSARDRYRFSLR